MKITAKGRHDSAGDPPRAPSRGAEVVAALRGRAKSDMTTDEIMKLTRG